MATLVLGTPPPELQALLERRRRAGVDRLDEVWEGVRHMVPAPSIEHAMSASSSPSSWDRSRVPPALSRP